VFPFQLRKHYLLWAESVFSNGWSFNSVENPVLKMFFERIRPSWKPPSAYQLSHKLLDSIGKGVESKSSGALSRACNITLMLDGWTDVTNTSLVNIAAYGDSPVFLKSVDPGAERHDAKFIAGEIINVMEGKVVAESDAGVVEQSGSGSGASSTVPPGPDRPRPVSVSPVNIVVDEHKVRSIVTDQPSVMTAAWDIVETLKPWVHCYGCGAHVINLLAADFRKIPDVNQVLEDNRKIVCFFRSHSLSKAILKAATKEKFGKPLNVVLSAATRWSTDYFMLLCNVSIKKALISAVVDSQLKKLLSANLVIKNLILSDDFWDSTVRTCFLLKPLMTGIAYCEGDDVPLSVMPRIWKHISIHIDAVSLKYLGFTDEVINAVTQAVAHREAMNTRPVTLAAHALDPRFREKTESLSEAQWILACQVIMKITESEHLDRAKVLGDLAEYRSKTGALFGNDVVWEAVNADACTNNPACWWSSYASSRALTKVAVILLSMPATAAVIERCNKTYAGTKTKNRNRLLSSRAAKLSIVAYNLRIQRSRSTMTKRRSARIRRRHILTLSVTRPCYLMGDVSSKDQANSCADAADVPDVGLSRTAGAAGTSDSNISLLLTESDAETSATPKNMSDTDESEESGTASDSDTESECNASLAESDADHAADEDSATEDDQEVSALPVTLIAGIYL